jgi:2,4-dienoyl-CoA reductase-like NADH-dependent reductase (Old Yellow Enzyme family)
MSVLFTSKKIGNIEIKNRFVNSATYESMAQKDGKVIDKLVQRYRKIANGGVGLIIPGYLYVHPKGKCTKYQTGIYNDDMIEGLKEMVDAVHLGRSKIVFQLTHSGRQTFKENIGQTPLAPLKGPMDRIYMAKPREMTEAEIEEAVKAFGSAAKRAHAAGADGVQIHSAHGYLVSQFLSPFFNRRNDKWGGSDENRFRFIKEIVSEIRKNIPEKMALLVKLNTQDFTPKEGITLDLAEKYAGWLADLPVDGLEVSCGTLSYSMFNMVRGDVPTEEIITNFPWWRKILGKMMLKKMEGKFDLEEGYNVEAAKLIKPVLGEKSLLVVGGLRRAKQMEEVIENNWNANINIRWGWLKIMYWYTIFGAGGFGLGIIVMPNIMRSIFGWPTQDPIVYGVAGSIWMAFGLLAILGLRSPLKFVPILLMQLC